MNQMMYDVFLHVILLLGGSKNLLLCHNLVGLRQPCLCLPISLSHLTKTREKIEFHFFLNYLFREAALYSIHLVFES